MKDFNEIYSKKYDYDDLKIAMAVQDYFRDCPIEKLEKFDFMEFDRMDYEDYVYLVNKIKEQWQVEKSKYENEEEADIDEEEIGYTQIYAYRYLEEKYKWAEGYTNTQKVLELIKEEYGKEREKTNPSNAQDFLEEIIEGVGKISRQKPIALNYATSTSRESGLIGVYYDDIGVPYSAYVKEERIGDLLDFGLVIVETNEELEILDTVTEIVLDSHPTLSEADRKLREFLNEE